MTIDPPRSDGTFRLHDSLTISNDERYKVNTADQRLLACDGSEEAPPAHWPASSYRSYCNLHILVAAFLKDRSAHTGPRGTSDELNATKCSESKPDTTKAFNQPEVQTALASMSMGRPLYCKDKIHRLVIVGDFLIELHQNYKELKDEIEIAALRKKVAALGDDIEDMLRGERLYRRIDAYARGGINAYADASSNDEVMGDKAERSYSAVQVLWHTKSYGNLVLFGDMGYAPLFAPWIEKDTVRCRCNGTPAETRRLRAENSVYYNAGAKWYLDHYRLALFLTAGQERVPKKDTITVQKDTLVLADNGVGPWSVKFDFGVNLQLFDVDDRDLLDYVERRPVLDLQVGFRYNSRYAPKGRLRAFHSPNSGFFADPRARWFWRMTVDLRSVIRNSASKTQNKLLSLMLVAERESDWAGGAHEWPSTTRIVAFADIHTDIFADFIGK